MWAAPALITKNLSPGGTTDWLAIPSQRSRLLPQHRPVPSALSPQACLLLLVMDTNLSPAGGDSSSDESGSQQTAVPSSRKPQRSLMAMSRTSSSD